MRLTAAARACAAARFAKAMSRGAWSWVALASRPTPLLDIQRIHYVTCQDPRPTTSRRPGEVPTLARHERQYPVTFQARQRQRGGLPSLSRGAVARDASPASPLALPAGWVNGAPPGRKGGYIAGYARPRESINRRAKTITNIKAPRPYCLSAAMPSGRDNLVA